MFDLIMLAVTAAALLVYAGVLFRMAFIVDRRVRLWLGKSPIRFHGGESF